MSCFYEVSDVGVPKTVVGFWADPSKDIESLVAGNRRSNLGGIHSGVARIRARCFSFRNSGVILTCS